MMIRSKLLQAAAFGALFLVGGMHTACAVVYAEGPYDQQPTKPNKQVVVITETSSTVLTPAQFAQLQTKANMLVEKERELVAAIQGAKNPGVIATLNKTLCNVTAGLFSLAKTGVVSAATVASLGLAEVAVLGYMGALALDPNGFIIRILGNEIIGYNPYSSASWYTRWITGQ